MHPRMISSNGRVADIALRDICTAEHYIEPKPMQIAEPLVDLCRAPGGARDRQLAFGAPVRLLEEREGWCFIQAVVDEYVGYVRQSSIGPLTRATHRIVTPLSHLYEAPKAQARDLSVLPFGARFAVHCLEGDFARTDGGYIPAQHLAPVKALMHDPVEIASRFLGVPYLWGGNSALGIDCSGLVQIAHLACGFACLGDADMQQQSLGETLPKDTQMRRGDLLFWRGHVAMVCSDTDIIHANGHKMAVTTEPLQRALLRIRSSEYGELLAHKRPKRG